MQSSLKKFIIKSQTNKKLYDITVDLCENLFKNESVKNGIGVSGIANCPYHLYRHFDR